MIKPEQIPDAVVKAFLNEVYDTEVEEPEWARIIIAATINAWPDAYVRDSDDYATVYEGDIVLPKVEKNDD